MNIFETFLFRLISFWFSFRRPSFHIDTFHVDVDLALGHSLDSATLLFVNVREGAMEIFKKCCDTPNMIPDYDMASKYFEDTFAERLSEIRSKLMADINSLAIPALLSYSQKSQEYTQISFIVYATVKTFDEFTQYAMKAYALAVGAEVASLIKEARQHTNQFSKVIAEA